MFIEPVSITPTAASRVLQIRESKKISSAYALRVGVNNAPGCGEKTFIIGFDKPGTNDIVYNQNGVALVIRKSEVLFLENVEVDYLEGEESGFSIEKKVHN